MLDLQVLGLYSHPDSPWWFCLHSLLDYLEDVCCIPRITGVGNLKEHSSCLCRLCLGRRSQSVSLAFLLC